jgi:putative tricarboxylic transport membrane protein
VESFGYLMQGFAVALTPYNLLWCFIGVFLGTVVGILPGLGPAATIAMLLPLTFQMNPTSAVIMLAGIYYGSKYGGSTTSILLNVPGESASVVTCFDGYQMARQGRAGAALGISAIASFIAGTFGVVGLMLIAPPLAKFALSFSSPEYFALMCLGLAMVVLLAGKSMIKALLAMYRAADCWHGHRFFTRPSRSRLAMPSCRRRGFRPGDRVRLAKRWQHANPRRRAGTAGPERPAQLRSYTAEPSRLLAAFLNGSVVGFIIGVLPGAGSTIASFISYGIEKAVSRRPEKFGTGVPEGVAAPEGANNAETGGAMVPLLTLGIPGSGTTAILLAAFILWGLRPGPLMIQDNPTLFWGLVASMYVGNVMLLVLNLPLIPLFAQILRLPAYVLYPFIFGISIVGVYSVSGSLFDTWMLALFGLLGYAMRRLDYPSAPLILGFVLGDSMERALRQSLMMSQGDPTILVARPMSATMLFLAVLILLAPLFRKANAWRVKAIAEGS